MVRPKILVAVFVVLSATVLLTAEQSLGEPAADTCRTTPGSSAPQGSHWYYRVNRGDNRHCWYLNSEGLKLHAHALGTEPRAASPSSMPEQEDAAVATPEAPSQLTPAQTAPAQMAPAQAAPVETLIAEPSADFAARWADLPSSVEPDAREASANGNADKFAAADFEQRVPMRQTESAGPMQHAAGGVDLGSVFLGGALLMAALFFSGGAFELARWRLREGRRSAMRADIGETGNRESAARARYRGPVRQVPIPTDPAHDLKISLRELTHDLQRADAARSTPRSFAPSAPQMRPSAADQRWSRSSGPSGRKILLPETVS